MNFTIPRPNVIECNKGYSVEVLGPTGLRYIENENVLLLDSEILAGPAGLILLTQGGALANLGAEEKQRIVENVRAAFKFRGFDIQIV